MEKPTREQLERRFHALIADALDGEGNAIPTALAWV